MSEFGRAIRIRPEWKPIFDSSDYSGYTHLAFRMNVEGLQGTNFKFYYKVEGTGGDTAVGIQHGVYRRYRWLDDGISAYRNFCEQFDGFAQKTQLLFLNNPESNETQTYLYLDSIRAVNKISIDDMAVKVGDRSISRTLQNFPAHQGYGADRRRFAERYHICP